jgi:protein-tyrosine-phosphatase
VTDDVLRPPRVLFICTGNAARSVMGGVALGELRPDVEIVTAGTLTIDGLPISWRTRAALESVNLPYPRHASKQVTTEHLAWADVVVAMAPEHVYWVRRNVPDAAARTATLIHLVDQLGTGPTPLAERVAALNLAEHELDNDEEVVDPGGGEVDVFIRCAEHVVELVNRFAKLL